MTLDDRIEQPTAADGRQPARADRPTKGRKAKRAARQASKAGTQTAKTARTKRTTGPTGPTGTTGTRGTTGTTATEQVAGTDTGQTTPSNAEPRLTTKKAASTGTASTKTASGAAGSAARLVGAGTPSWALAAPAASQYATHTVRDHPVGTAPSTRPATKGAPGDVTEDSAEDVAGDAAGDATETAPADAAEDGPTVTSEASEGETRPAVGASATETDVSADSEPKERTPAAEIDGAVAETRQPDEGRKASSADPAALAFDLLHVTHAAALSRQAYLLTGNREASRWAVDRAFHTAWEHWPEVATDPDPAGWVRAVVHELALSPWLRFWPGHGAPEPYDGPPEHRVLLLAFWGLPRAYRRTVLLHDGLGLSLAETAAETEASTPATLGRLRHGREALAVLVPEVADVGRSGDDDTSGTGTGTDLGSDERGAVLGALLAQAGAAHQVRPRTSRAVRTISENATRRWTLGACGLTAVLVMATSFTIATTESDSLLPTGLPATVAELAR